MAERRQRLASTLLTALVWLTSAGVAACFFWILADLVQQGADHLSWDFLSSEPERAGRDGGIAPILVSTLLVLAISLSAALPLGIGTALWLHTFTPAGSRLSRMIRLLLDILAGVPSIVFGIFGGLFFCVWLGLGFSLLAGGLTLACMILPLLIRTTEAGLASVPVDWGRGAAALGMSRTATLRHVLLPAAAPAVISGLMLSMGRVLAETAVLIFTSGYVDRMPDSLLDSGRVLAVHIYDLSMNVTGGDRAAYGSALVLIALLLVVNGLAAGLASRWLTRSLST